MAKDNTSRAAARPIAPVQAGPGAWQWMGDSLITANGLFVIHATATAECGRVNDCGAAKAAVHFTCTHRHLIAAAPDLLEALKAAQMLAASGPAPLPPSDPRWAQIADAIAKAGG